MILVIEVKLDPKEMLVNVVRKRIKAMLERRGQMVERPILD